MHKTRRYHLLLPVLAALLAAGPARAMQFQLLPAANNSFIILARGEIHQGDLRLLRQALADVPAGHALQGMMVDSPGGNLLEGENLAAQISASKLAVMVDSNSQCASACFLLLAASPHRIAGTSALVGVHSASVEGKETTDSMARTLQMQRVAAGYGVPPAIIGKMAQTTPGRVDWLTLDDLASMSVQVIDTNHDASNAPPSTASAARTAPPPPGPPAQSPAQSPAMAPAMAPMPRQTTALVAQAEFQGALFCQQGAAKLSLQIVEITNGAVRRAVFHFAPTTASRQFTSGSFLMQGRLDLAGGGIDLQPTQWLSVPPANFAMVGLVGRSDDGGKTFAGRATATPSCTVFTLKRTR